jgi:hypothetical protein
MAYLLVMMVAAAVGAAAYLMTLRQGAAHAAAGPTRSNQPVGVPVPGSGQTYVTVTDTRLDWESRLTGALGLVIAVIAGAAVLALSAYVSVSFLVKLIKHAVG